MFLTNPRRILMWKMERRVLNAIFNSYIHSNMVCHLDFACGTGRILKLLEGRVGESIGIDVSASMLRVAAEVAKNAQLVEADITRDDVLHDRKFDVITAFRFFPKAEPSLRSAVMAELVSRLAPGGVLIWNNHCHSGSLGLRLVRLVKRRAIKVSEMSRIECEELIANHGLRISEVYHLGHLPDFETRPLRPRWLISWIENAARYLPLAPLAENLIFVCSRDS